MRLRPATEDDLVAVCELGVAEEAAWFGAPEVSGEEIAEWLDEYGGVATGVVAVDDDGTVRGYATPGRQEAVLIADPAHTDTLVDLLLPWLRDQLDATVVPTFAGDTARVAALERHGLRHKRSAFTLARPTAGLAAAAVPTGIDIQAYALGDDDNAVHRLIYVDADWAAVEGHTARDLRAWQQVMRPHGSLFLARRQGRPAGFVAGRILDTGRGYISTLAVAADERRQGLGRALLLHTFADLQRLGAADLALGVEAHNEGALDLYRSVGLEVEREWRIFLGSRPGA